MTSFPPLTHATSCILLVMLLLLCILHVWRVCPMLRKAPSLQRNLQIAYELSLGVLFLNLTICARIFAEGKVMVNSLLPVIFDCRVFLYAGILCFILSIPVLVASKQPRVAAEGLLALACTPLFGYAVPNLYFLPIIACQRGDSARKKKQRAMMIAPMQPQMMNTSRQPAIGRTIRLMKDATRVPVLAMRPT